MYFSVRNYNEIVLLIIDLIRYTANSYTNLLTYISYLYEQVCDYFFSFLCIIILILRCIILPKRKVCLLLS